MQKNAIQKVSIMKRLIKYWTLAKMIKENEKHKLPIKDWQREYDHISYSNLKDNKEAVWTFVWQLANSDEIKMLKNSIYQN